MHDTLGGARGWVENESVTATLTKNARTTVASLLGMISTSCCEVVWCPSLERALLF